MKSPGCLTCAEQTSTTTQVCYETYKLTNCTEYWIDIVFFAYAVITNDQTLLFANPAQLDAITIQHLGSEVEVRPYDHFFPHLRGLGAELNLSREAVCISSSSFRRSLFP